MHCYMYLFAVPEQILTLPNSAKIETNSVSDCYFYLRLNLLLTAFHFWNWISWCDKTSKYFPAQISKFIHWSNFIFSSGGINDSIWKYPKPYIRIMISTVLIISVHWYVIQRHTHLHAHTQMIQIIRNKFLYI